MTTLNGKVIDLSVNEYQVSSISAKLTLNGMIKDLPIDQYHASEGLSASGIKELLKCPKKYWYKYLNPSKATSQDFKEKKCLIIGQALHTKVLEPYAFNNRFYTVGPELESLDKRKTENKAIFNKFLAANEHKTRLTHADMEQVQCMADAVFSNHDYTTIMSHKENVHVETSLYFKPYDVLLKSRPDLFNDFMVLDLKTTMSASEDDFKKDIHKYGYHIQAALALDALEYVCPQPSKREFVILAVEKTAPYLTAVYRIDEESIEVGRKKYKEGINIYKECLRNKRWNGYPEGIRSIGLPAWAINQSMTMATEMISAPF